VDYALKLRDVRAGDLPFFFEHQLDPAARFMVAFVFGDPNDREAFMTKWAKNLADPSMLFKTIEVDGAIAGNVSSFTQFGKPSIGYWLGCEFWGRKIATRAVQAFLPMIPARPLYARIAKDNLGSLGVLDRCGFKIIGEDQAFANGRGQEIEEFILEMR
jgi:RimJ/RimL family protein N-acetyltransferase